MNKINTMVLDRDLKLMDKFTEMGMDMRENMYARLFVTGNFIEENYLIMYAIDLDDRIYCVFVKDSIIASDDTELVDIVLEGIIETIQEMNETKADIKSDISFVAVTRDRIEDYLFNDLMTVDEALKLYNEALEFPRTREEFEIEFEKYIFSIGELKLIKLSNIMFRLA